jgi:hypothetical protein
MSDSDDLKSLGANLPYLLVLIAIRHNPLPVSPQHFFCTS